jgi:hypothetical protein
MKWHTQSSFIKDNTNEKLKTIVMFCLSTHGCHDNVQKKQEKAFFRWLRITK